MSESYGIVKNKLWAELLLSRNEDSTVFVQRLGKFCFLGNFFKNVQASSAGYLWPSALT